MNDSRYRKAKLRLPEAEALQAIDELITAAPRPFAFKDRRQLHDFYADLREWNGRVEAAAENIFSSNAYAEQHAHASDLLQQTESWEEEVSDAGKIWTMYMESLLDIRRAITLPDLPPTFYSCFISYSRIDKQFAALLGSSLIKNQVDVWKDTENMEAGRFWRAQIHEIVKSYDKLILVCSRHSVLRLNVVDEIASAMEREREMHVQKLFPIRLDDFILSDEMLRAADSKLRTGEWREDWVRYVRAYHIPDFSRWKRMPTTYELEFQKLLSALRTPGNRR
jgi:hypothetical protein